jgi:NRAMP (natural resistance-associated macrophage protein)-like metal ion transporter
LGPGLITGAADDDPSGIATYSQVGAQFGFGLLWVMLFSYPLMCGIQEISGHIGRITGRGIAGNLRRYYHPAILYVLIILMLVANIINLGADIGAMGDALKLLIGGSSIVYAALLTIISAVLETVMPYERYAKALKWMCLVLFAYVGTVFVVHIPWSLALRATFLPSLRLNITLVTSLVAVLGTTISPYLFFWQAQEEVEIEKANPKEHPLTERPRHASSQLHRIRVDTYWGMAFSNIVAYFIMLTTGATLHMHGVTNIETSSQAAEALRPIAGQFAFLLFALGIVGTGLLALPVFAGSAAYAVGEAFQWKVGLNKSPIRAKGFYGILVASFFIGLSLNFFHLNPIKALFWSAVINGIVAVPIMFLMMHMGQNSKVMGQFTLGRTDKVLGWAATLVMTAAAIGLFATWGK